MERRPSFEAKARTLLGRSGPLRSRDLVAAGLTRSHLSRLVARGTIVRVARGLYVLPQRQLPSETELITVAARAPRVVFCLLTALRLHELTTQAPSEVWIAIGNKDHPPRLDHPPLRVIRFSEESLGAGVEVMRRDGVPIRVTNVAKTLADCFKFRSRIGLDVALEALREARARRRFSQDELWRYARINRVANVMRPYLEAIS